MPERVYANRFPTLEEYDEEIGEHGLDFEPSFLVQMRRALAIALVIDESLGMGAHVAAQGADAVGVVSVPPPRPSVPPTPRAGHPLIHYAEALQPPPGWQRYAVGTKGVPETFPAWVSHQCPTQHALMYLCRVIIRPPHEGSVPSYGVIGTWRDNVMYVMVDKSITPSVT